MPSPYFSGVMLVFFFKNTTFKMAIKKGQSMTKQKNSNSGKGE